MRRHQEPRDFEQLQVLAYAGVPAVAGREPASSAVFRVVDPTERWDWNCGRADHGRRPGWTLKSQRLPGRWPPTRGGWSAAAVRCRRPHACDVELAAAHEIVDYEHAFLHALLDNLDTGVAACDSDGRLTFFNRGMREMHGRDAGADRRGRAGRRTTSCTSPDGRTLLEPEVPLARANAGDTVRGQQMVVKHQNGERRLVANARPIDTPDGRRLGAVVAMHDITEAAPGRGAAPRPARRRRRCSPRPPMPSKPRSMRSPRSPSSWVGSAASTGRSPRTARDHPAQLACQHGDRDLAGLTREQPLASAAVKACPAWSGSAVPRCGRAPATCRRPGGRRTAPRSASGPSACRSAPAAARSACWSSSPTTTCPTTRDIAAHARRGRRPPRAGSSSAAAPRT